MTTEDKRALAEIERLRKALQSIAFVEIIPVDPGASEIILTAQELILSMRDIAAEALRGKVD